MGDDANAITTKLLRSAIQIEGTANQGIEERKQVLLLKEIHWLNFSYRGIKNIDYLVGLERLTKLQLDNNNLSKIENLGHLVNLTDLDLSFNHIKKIENLSALTGLLDLSLYSNKITQFEGLDALEELKSLSLGNNQIKHLDEVLYLRQFRFLRLLCLEGNPLCKDPEYRLFTIAWMRNLMYLDHHFCFPKLTKEARDTYQDAMTEQGEKDRLDTIAWTRSRAKRVEAKMFLLCHLDGMYEFFDYMFARDEENEKLLSVPGLVEAGVDAYREKFMHAVEDLIAKIVTIHNKRVEERRLYELAVKGVLARRDGEGRTLLYNLHKKRKKVFEECLVDRSDAQPKLLELLRDCDVLQDKLMETEVETYGEVNKLWNEFEDTFYETLDHAKNFFADFYGNMRAFEGEWSETLVAASLAISDKFDIGDLEGDINDVAFALLSDKEVMSNAISASKDGHGLTMDLEEDVKVKAIEALRKKTYEDGMAFMIKRNREKISEIWFIVKKYKDEVNDMMQQVAHVSDVPSTVKP